MSDPKERLSLVTDFNALKAGDLVVVMPCSWCGGKHRSLLLGPTEHIYRRSDGERYAGIAFDLVPISCGEVLSPRAVASGNVYRVDAGLSDSKTTETAKPRRLERVR